MPRPIVHINLYLDYICPWCYLALKRILRIKEGLKDSIEIDLDITPYILYPFIPKEGMPKAAFAHKSKPGMGRQLKEAAQIKGIRFLYGKIDRITYSIHAHQFTQEIEDNVVKIDLANQLFKAYFEEGKDIGSLDILGKIAEQSGVSDNSWIAFLQNSHHKTIDQLIAAAHADSILTVPNLRLEKLINIPGLQEEATLLNFIHKAVQLQER